MAMTISFGESSGSSIANIGFILLILAIFLFFTGMWRMISTKWNNFFSASLWTQTIGNAKATWASVPPVMTPSTVQPPPPGSAVPMPALMPMGTTQAVVPVVNPAGIAGIPGAPPNATATSTVNPSPLTTT